MGTLEPDRSSSLTTLNRHSASDHERWGCAARLLRPNMIAAVCAAFVKPDKPVVLCVEDDEAQQRLLKAILETGGFRVLQATTADEGLRLFRDNQIALVVIDQRLGNKQITGAELARMVKAKKPKVPVVLRSGYPPEGIGVYWDVFINKGERVKDFLGIVRDLIKRYSE